MKVITIELDEAEEAQLATLHEELFGEMLPWQLNQNLFRAALLALYESDFHRGYNGQPISFKVAPQKRVTNPNS